MRLAHANVCGHHRAHAAPLGRLSPAGLCRSLGSKSGASVAHSVCEMVYSTFGSLCCAVTLLCPLILPELMFAYAFGLAKNSVRKP